MMLMYLIFSLSRNSFNCFAGIAGSFLLAYLTCSNTKPLPARIKRGADVGRTGSYGDQEPRQRLGVRQSAGAIQGATRSKAPGDWRTPRPGGESMVHGQNRRT